VAAYLEVRLAELVEHVGRVIDKFRARELDVFAAARVLYQYSRSAKELWKFCNLTDVEVTAHAMVDRRPIDRWERGALKPPLFRCARNWRCGERFGGRRCAAEDATSSRSAHDRAGSCVGQRIRVSRCGRVVWLRACTASRGGGCC